MTLTYRPGRPEITSVTLASIAEGEDHEMLLSVKLGEAQLTMWLDVDQVVELVSRFTAELEKGAGAPPPF